MAASGSESAVTETVNQVATRRFIPLLPEEVWQPLRLTGVVGGDWVLFLFRLKLDTISG